MLLYALKNVDNPVNFPIEVRVNVCTFFLQLQRHASAESLAHVKAAALPVAEYVVEDLQEEPSEEKLFKAATALVKSWTTSTSTQPGS